MFPVECLCIFYVFVWLIKGGVNDLMGVSPSQCNCEKKLSEGCQTCVLLSVAICHYSRDHKNCDKKQQFVTKTRFPLNITTVTSTYLVVLNMVCVKVKVCIPSK